MIMSLVLCNCVMFVCIVYNLLMILFFFFISLPFMVNNKFSKLKASYCIIYSGYYMLNSLRIFWLSKAFLLVTRNG